MLQMKYRVYSTRRRAFHDANAQCPRAGEYVLDIIRDSPWPVK